MLKHATKLLTLLLLVLLALPAQAQDPAQVTARDINAIPPDQVNQLNAAGENLGAGEIPNLIYNDETNGARVQITAVFMSDPFNSGLGNIGGDGQPSRIHAFVRDTSAVSSGVEGMGIQLVDGAPETTGILNYAVGDVVTIIGDVGPFGQTMQISPESFEFLGTREDLGLPASLMDPVVITTDQANKAVGSAGGVQTNWDNWEDLRGQFVRVEGARLQARSLANPDRPDYYTTTDDGTTVLNSYESSIQFRNDRSDYPDGFNVLDDDFVPPPPGAFINIQGFLIMQAFSDGFGRSVPASGFVSLVPFERRGCGVENSPLRCDFEVTEVPPEASVPSKPDFVPTSSQSVPVVTDVTTDPSRQIASVTLNYTTSDDATERNVVMAPTEGKVSQVGYGASIPAQDNGVFVVYTVTATDNTGAEFTSNEQNYRVLDNGINAISQVQQTYDGGPGDGPFRGLVTDMDITATVQSDPSVSGGFDITIQDNLGLAPWTGILLDANDDLINDLARGDVINITNAEIEERFGVTRLTDITYTKESSGNPYGYRTLTTDVMQDASIAESYEGMLVRFDDVSVMDVNPDAPNGPFGEWTFSSDGTADNALRADDASPGVSIGGDAGTVFAVGNKHEFMKGIWWFSFGNYKLIPEDLDSDVGMITNTSTEDDVLPGSFVLEQNYPNPFNPSTNIKYTIGQANRVTLEVFDMLGRKVATLVNNEMAPGTHSVTFDATGLSSGLYLYRLESGSKVEMKKMMLLK